MKKKQLKWLSIVLAAVLGVSVLMTGCGSSGSSAGSAAPAGEKKEEAVEETKDEATQPEAEAAETEAAAAEAAEQPAQDAPADAAAEPSEEVTLTLFAAKSLNTVMEDIIAVYQEAHPGVKIVGNYDSSGTLMTQIQEGAACDVFFSAAQKQMNTLEEEGFLVEGTRHNVVNNQVIVVTYPGSGTQVTGLADLSKAANMALADGSVPVGKYTRQALVNAGMIEAPAEGADVSEITTQQVSEALGGLEINECANVGAVTAAVAEAANEVGTVYYSDTYGLEDRLEILETVPYDLTGNVIYPVAQIVNPEASEAQAAAALEFVNYIASEEAKETFRAYYFDTDVTD
ncbi:MAG: molybdate ABC transporter substrate-binding protein [Eubacteriales bacterium]|nr:molybdate ABC transporter substrate-binding protein [Eubacteriales bacterium]